MSDEPRERRRRRTDLAERPPVIEAEPVPAPDPSEVELEDRRLAVFRRESFVGPVPPPAIMQAYEEIYPGAAAEIFNAWHVQSRHRQEIERKVIDADIRAEWRGLHLAFILALVVVIGGFVLIALDKDVYGLVAIIGTLVSLAGVFVYSKQRQASELAEKTPSAPGPTEKAAGDEES